MEHRTKSGKILTDADLDALATDELLANYDIEELRSRAKYFLSGDLVARGLVHQTTSEDLLPLLNQPPLTLYSGFDPTAPSLHVGNLLQLITLARFQRYGHTPIVLAGGATGMIGDPSGKSSERNLLTTEHLTQNLAGIMPQLTAFLDFEGPNAARLVNNLDWVSPLSALDFLRDVGKHFTINNLLTRDAVSSRFNSTNGLSFTEFSYALLQAYDFLHLYQTYGCTLQIGATDQWSNITSGVDLIRRIEGAQAFGLTTPLLTRSHGTKFGKTEQGAIFLSADLTSPYAFFQFFLGVEDSKVIEYLKLLTFIDLGTIQDLKDQTESAPHKRAAQRALARALTDMVHPGELPRIERASAALFTQEIKSLDETTLRQIADSSPSSQIPFTQAAALPFIDLLVTTNLCSSKRDARTTLQQGGISVNNQRVNEAFTLTTNDLLAGGFVLLRRGKKTQHLLHLI